MENQLAVTQQTQFDIFNPTQFETMQRVCKMYASSELVPDIYKTSDKNPENKAISNCMVAVEMSLRIGASALMVMQNMDIIYGRPSWRSKFLIATVNTCGRFEPLEFKFSNLGKIGKIKYTTYEKEYINGENGKKGYYKNKSIIEEFDGTNVDNIQCIAFTSPKGSQKVLESSPVSIKLAIEEGWYTKSGSKWKTIPQQMLIYRAASFWTSTYAPEISMGMKTTDEMEDIGDIIDAKFEDITNMVKSEIESNANKGENISFESEKQNSESDKKQDHPKETAKPKVENKSDVDINRNKLIELGYSEDEIKSFTSAKVMEIIIGNIKKSEGPGF